MKLAHCAQSVCKTQNHAQIVCLHNYRVCLTNHIKKRRLKDLLQETECEDKHKLLKRSCMNDTSRVICFSCCNS